MISEDAQRIAEGLREHFTEINEEFGAFKHVDILDALRVLIGNYAELIPQTKAPEFMQTKVIEGLTKSNNDLGKFGKKYTIYGNSLEVLKTLKLVQYLILMEAKAQ